MSPPRANAVIGFSDGFFDLQKKAIKLQSASGGNEVIISDNFIRNLTCDSLCSVGDIVYSAGDDYVRTTPSNTLPTNSFAIIIEKPTATTCHVQFLGQLESLNFPGILRGKLVAIGVDGKPTQVKPDSGYIEIIGHAYADNKIFLNFSPQRIKLL